MKNLAIKEFILKETELLKTKEKKERILNSILSIMVFIILVMSSVLLVRPFLNFIEIEDRVFSAFGFCVIPIIGGFIAVGINKLIIDNIFNHEDTEKMADKKAKELSINRLLPVFMKAFAEINNKEDEIKNLEEHVKQIMEEVAVTWYDSKNELTIQWAFNAKSFKCTLNDKSVFLKSISIEERLSTFDKMVVGIKCLVEKEKKDKVNIYSEEFFFITIKN